MSAKQKKQKKLNDLDANDCRWPIGDPRQDDFHFCAAPKELGRPYCAHHCALSFDNTKLNRRSEPRPLLPIRQAA